MIQRLGKWSVAASSAVAFLMMLCIACFPVVENVAKRHPVDTEVHALIGGGNEDVLVLPIWRDDGACQIRAPFLVSGTEDVNSIGEIRSRRKVGLFDLQGHTPSHKHYVGTIVVLTQQGRLVWLRTSSELWTVARTAFLGPLWTKELNNLLSDAAIDIADASVFGPLQDDYCRPATVSVIADKRERQAILEFLGRIPEDEVSAESDSANLDAWHAI